MIPAVPVASSIWAERLLVQNSQYFFSPLQPAPNIYKQAQICERIQLNTDGRKFLGNDSGQTQPHNMRVSPCSRGIEDLLTDNISSSCPAPLRAIGYSLTKEKIYVTSVKQVISFQQLLYTFNGFEPAVGEK